MYRGFNVIRCIFSVCISHQRAVLSKFNLAIRFVCSQPDITFLFSKKIAFLLLSNKLFQRTFYFGHMIIRELFFQPEQCLQSLSSLFYIWDNWVFCSFQSNSGFQPREFFVFQKFVYHRAYLPAFE